MTLATPTAPATVRGCYSSDSIKVSGSAAQLTATNGPLARGLS